MLNPFCSSKEWSETFYPPFANRNAISEQLFANKALHCLYSLSFHLPSSLYCFKCSIINSMGSSGLWINSSSSMFWKTTGQTQRKIKGLSVLIWHYSKVVMRTLLTPLLRSPSTDKARNINPILEAGKVKYGFTKPSSTLQIHKWTKWKPYSNLLSLIYDTHRDPKGLALVV